MLDSILIKQISTSPNPLSGGVNVIGLGVDNRVYLWHAQAGMWIPNWQVKTTEVRQEKPVKNPVVKKKVATKKKATKKKK